MDKIPGATTEWIEGRCAYYSDLPETENPYLTQKGKSKLKEDWNKKAQDWDDGWAEARVQVEGEKF